MATVSYSFVVGQDVFYLDVDTGIHEAIVGTVSIIVSISGTIKTYSIAFIDPTKGTLITTEDTLYTDVDSALAAYRIDLIA